MLIGAFLNVAGILIGGIIGLVRRKPLSVAQESWFKVALGAFTVFYGLRLTWSSLSGGSFSQALKQLLITIVALMLGKIFGHLLGFQKASNRLGQKAKEIIATATAGSHKADDGFKTCALLYCAAPLGILGSVADGLSGYFYPLAVKGVIDGLATLGFVPLFGWSVLLAALPVLTLQGGITLGCAQLAKSFPEHQTMLLSVNAVAGLLIFAVALVILQIKRIELADYLPSLMFAPVLTRFLA